ncbi:hypothetical protein VDIAB_100013 [Vibrio diabolicus]|nr:hypothetical protein VDIAB_100013 [Vibrio diabolicus]
MVVFGTQKYNSYESNEIKYRSVDIIGFDSRSRGELKRCTSCAE